MKHINYNHKKLHLYSLEHDIVPYHAIQPIGEKVLVLSPHPDDETLGCGGTIKRLLDAGKEVMVVFLTSGDKADINNPLSKKYHYGSLHITDYSIMREKEAEKALRCLGVHRYEFLRYPDRELHLNINQLINNLDKFIKTFNPDTIYSPSMVELNPDHRTTAYIAKACKDKVLHIVYYEITVPLRPNVIVDITNIKHIKESAIKQYTSQISLVNYDEYIFSLNRLRSLTVENCQYCEAFWLIDDISEHYFKEWLSYDIAINSSFHL